MSTSKIDTHDMVTGFEESIEFNNKSEGKAITKRRTIGSVDYAMRVSLLSPGSKPAAALELFTDPNDLENATAVMGVTDKDYLGPYFAYEGSENYRLFGGHNKPSGSYDGNGNVASRTVNVGTGFNPTGYLIITCRGLIGFVGAYGGVFFDCSKTDGTVQYLASSEVKFTGGVLTIASTSGYVNRSGNTYNYQVL